MEYSGCRKELICMFTWMLLVFFPSCALAQAWSTGSYVRAAIEASPELVQYRQRLEVSKTGYSSSLAGAVLPTLSFSAVAYPWGYDLTGIHRHWELNRDNMNFNTTLKMNLFNSFEDRLKVRQSRLDLKLSEWNLQSQKQSTAFGALKTFYTLMLKEKLLDVARGNAKARQDQYLLTREQYKDGMKSLSDLLKSETDWLSGRLRKSNAESQYQDALMQFNLLLDRDPGQKAVLRGALETGTTVLSPVTSGVEQALSVRPEIEALRVNLDKASVSLRQSVRSSLPDLSVDVNWTRRGFAGIGLPASGTANPNYNLSLNVSLPFGFNAASQYMNVKAARARKRRTIGEFDELRRRVRKEVHSSHIALSRALRSYEIAALKEDISKRNLEIVKEQYRQGIANVIRLAQARQDYLEAQVERVQALNDAWVNRAQYRLATGDPLY